MTHQVMPALKFQEDIVTTNNHSHQPTNKKKRSKKVAEEVITDDSISFIEEENTPETTIEFTEPEVLVEEAIVTQRVISEEKPVKPKTHETKAIKNPRSPFKESEPNGHLIRLGEEVVVPGDDLGTAIRVSEDVYREVLPRNSKRSSYILVFPKGSLVPKHSAQKLG